ncbi:MAG: hypothetical protein L0Y44_13130 [Phycisphaerales bacterium]|nr:hypothetical protein [Phycisphaerales bacterium]MCI0631587.1 hypothetical protein [Phycisphaerales bacterium]MCI0674156.1 hypothetical protein [Phycisphaerales bacterium]
MLYRKSQLECPTHIDRGLWLAGIDALSAPGVPGSSGTRGTANGMNVVGDSDREGPPR